MADEKKKAGRKGKYDTHVLPFFVDIEKHLQNGASEKQVAEDFLNISYAAWNKYKQDYPEFRELCEKPRTKVVFELRSALVKRALGFSYEEKEQYVKQEIDPDTKQPTGSKIMHTKIVTKQALPDTTAIFGALNIYDDEYVKDKKAYDLKKQELELRRMKAEMEDF